MGACPFCKASINEEILLYGGRCPGCFNEIPGEEAPTDPGAQARANTEREVQAAQKNSKAPLIAGALAVLGLLAVGGWYLSQPPPTAVTELPEIVINKDLSGHINPDLPEEPPPTEVPREVVSNSRPRNPTAPPTGGQVIASTSTPPQQSNVGPTTTTSSGLDLDIGVSLNPGAAMPQQKVLSSDAEIQTMISNTLGSYISRLQGCYNTRLKEKDDIKGTWQVSFNVTTSGQTSNIAVAGRGMSDAPLEDCLQRQAERFTFQKIAREKPVSVPLRFGT